MSNPTLDSAAITQRGVQLRDDNGAPVSTAGGLITSVSTTFTGSNATVNTPLFHITGTVMIYQIWGVVTTVLGANHTAAAWRLNDQTSQVYITAVGGVDISALAAGTCIVKKGLVAAAAVKLDNAAGVVSEPTTLETDYFSPCVLVKKTAATTDIEYHYATTDTPTSGAMTHFVNWYPLSADGKVTPI